MKAEIPLSVVLLGLTWLAVPMLCVLVCEFLMKTQIYKANFPKPKTCMGTICRRRNFLAIHELLFPQSKLRNRYQIANSVAICSMFILFIAALLFRYYQK